MKKVATILLYNDKKEFLLQLRTDDAPTYPSCYGFFGGKIEEGEKPEDAIKRECLEELKYELENPELILNTIREGKYGKRDLHLFIEKYNPNKKLVLCEGKEMHWIGQNESKNLKVTDFLVDVLEEMYNKI